MKDINFNTNDGIFNFRVAAYVICEDKMLIEHTIGNDFVNLIGGRVHLGEDTISAIKREVKEEIGVSIKNQKLMVVAENFFKWQGKNAHELLFIYKIELAKKYLKLNGSNVLDENSQYVEWVEKSKINNYVCKPSLIYKLPELEKGPHIIHTIGD